MLGERLKCRVAMRGIADLAVGLVELLDGRSLWIERHVGLQKYAQFSLAAVHDLQPGVIAHVGVVTALHRYDAGVTPSARRKARRNACTVAKPASSATRLIDVRAFVASSCAAARNRTRAR